MKKTLNSIYHYIIVIILDDYMGIKYQLKLNERDRTKDDTLSTIRRGLHHYKAPSYLIQTDGDVTIEPHSGVLPEVAQQYLQNFGKLTQVPQAD